jgi:secretion/DNA translocation related CpaE-like protein
VPSGRSAPARALPAGPSLARPLVVSADEDLLDDVLRVLAAAGTEAELATAGPALRRAYREAPVVLVGADALIGGSPVGAVLGSLPRRPGVIAVTRDDLPPAGWARAVEIGAERVVRLPDDESWLLARAAGAVRAPVDRGWLVAVGGSCGGAGASTVAAAVALAAAPDCVLVDADPWGGGLDLLLGVEGVEGLRWPELAGVRGRLAGDALLAGLPEVDGVSVLAASRSTPITVTGEALTAVVEAIRGEGVPVVVDLPRGQPTGEPASAALAEADLTLLVVPARLRAATAARLLVQAPGSAWATAHLVVRPVAGGLSCAEVAELVGRPVLAELPHDRSAGPRAERGEPPLVSARSPLGGSARRILAHLRPAGGAR